MRSFSRAASAWRPAPLSSVWLRARGAAAGLLAVGLLTSERASADTQACVAAHASGQREVKAGRLTAASELFTSCGSDSSCPEPLRAECTELLEKARTATPTVILAVLDEHGGDVSQVKVYSADELIADGLDGRTVALNPGKHRLRFLLPWGEVLSADVLIREGEKNRVVQVRVEPKVKPEPKPAPAAQPAAAPAPPPPPPPRSTPVAAWAATGVAVVGAGVFGTFAFLGSRSKADIDECAPRCPRSLEGTRDDLKRSYLVADIGLGTAVVSGIVAVVLFASHGPSDEARATASPSSTGLNAGLSSWSNGAGFVLSGDFR